MRKILIVIALAVSMPLIYQNCAKTSENNEPKISQTVVENEFNQDLLVGGWLSQPEFSNGGTVSMQSGIFFNQDGTFFKGIKVVSSLNQTNGRESITTVSIDTQNGIYKIEGSRFVLIVNDLCSRNEIINFTYKIFRDVPNMLNTIVDGPGGVNAVWNRASNSDIQSFKNAIKPNCVSN